MKKYEETIPDYDVVLSTRVRYARNIEDYPFDLSFSRAMGNELVERVRNSLGNEFLEQKMGQLSAADRLCLCEKHLISPEFMKKDDGVLFSQEENGIYIMVMEEDHIRLQVIDAGYCPSVLLEKADALLCNMETKLRFSFDEKLGYLTRCPSNLGHGLRFSVMVFLPGLQAQAKIGRLQQNLTDLGFNLRGMYGEGSKSGGCLYQISNRSSLGMTKESLLLEFNSVIARVVSAERSAREGLDRDILQDNAGRGYGILAYAGRISYEEFLTHYTNLRTACALQLDLPSNCNIKLLDELLVSVSPGTIAKTYACKNSEERDLARANYLKIQMRGDKI